MIVDVVAVIGALGGLIGLINGLLDLYDRVRRSKDREGSVQVFTERRIYIVPLDLGDDGPNAIRAIPDDLGDGDDERRGDMTWRDERWNTIDELHGE